MSIKLSFIIPVYNVENYVGMCIDSILSQAGPETELILVDDGSTDGSGAICDRYAQQNGCIKVIHQENRGHSAARNAGLDAACGEYVAFVDSDDYIGGGSLEAMLEYISKGGSDICFMDAFKVFPDGTTEALGDAIERIHVRGKGQAEVMGYLSARPKFPGSACTKVFRRSFLEKNRIRFPLDMLHGEDLSVCMDAFLKAETFDALNVPYYYYRQGRPGSVTEKTDDSAFRDLAAFVKAYSERLVGSPSAVKATAARYAMAFVAYEYSILLWTYSWLAKDRRPEALRFLKSHRWVLRYNPTTKIRCIRLAAAVFGLRFTSGLLGIYMKNRK